MGTLDLSLMLHKRITIVGTTLPRRPLEEKIAATSRFAGEVCPWLERGLVRPVVDSVFTVEEVHAAQARLESNLVFGKVILRLWQRAVTNCFEMGQTVSAIAPRWQAGRPGSPGPGRRE